MRKPELLAPAGDLEKLKIAIQYGADAVFIGAQELSLRARASNFTIEDVREAVEFANQYGAKIYVTTNILPHKEDLGKIEEHLKNLESVGVSGVICASQHIAKMASKTNLEVHISTQQSVANSRAVNFFKTYGATRVVLARELTVPEIKLIRKNTDLELEVFIHGGMCSSYSGRCTLSNTFTQRDANRGGCAHSCRWNYDIFDNEGNNKTSDTHKFSMSSKDLQSLYVLKDLLDVGVNSLKIEGRMKSIHYIATIVSVYRKFIDDWYDNSLEDIESYANEIRKAENRLTSTGFLAGEISINQQLYNMRSENPTQEFVGIVREYDSTENVAIIEQRNYFTPNDKLEVFGPGLLPVEFVIDSIKDTEGNVLDAARHPKQILKISIPIMVKENYMIRKVK